MTVTGKGRQNVGGAELVVGVLGVGSGEVKGQTRREERRPAAGQNCALQPLPGAEPGADRHLIWIINASNCRRMNRPHANQPQKGGGGGVEGLGGHITLSMKTFPLMSTCLSSRVQFDCPAGPFHFILKSFMTDISF